MENNPIIDALKTVFKIILSLVIIAILIWGGIKIYNKYVNDTPPTDDPIEDPVEDPDNGDDDAVKVEVIEAEIDEEYNDPIEPDEDSFSKTGVIVADQEIEILPDVSALVSTINVNEGDQVTAGQSLANLSDSIQIKQAIASYNGALAQLQNAQRILQTTQQSNYLTQTTFQNQIRTAQNNIQNAYDNLNTTQIIRYEQYQLEDSQRFGQDMQADLQAQQANQEADTRGAAETDPANLQDKIDYNSKFNVHQSRYVQQLQGQSQDRQNYRSVQEAQNQMDQLLKQLSGTRVQGDLQALNVQSQVLQIQSQLEQAKINLEAGKIESPINGVVTRVNVRPGDKVSQQTAMFTITNFDSIIATANLTAEEAIQLNENTSTSIEVLGTKIPAQIISLSLTADPQTKTIPVKVVPTIEVTTPMIPNTFTKINFDPSQNNEPAPVDPNTFTLPVSIMQFHEDGIYVPVIENDKVTYKKITLALPVQNGRAGIKSGLEDGDLVITSHSDLEEGTKVTTNE